MRFTVPLCLALLLVLYAQSGRISGQSQPAINSLSVEDVVGLVKKGFSEDVIITRIRKYGKAFDLSPDELVELRKLGVPDNIIRYLLDPSLPYTPPPPPAPPPATTPPVAATKSPAPAKTYVPDK